VSRLNVARLVTRLRNLFVLRGEPIVAPEVEDVIMPVKEMERERPEDLWLGGELLQWGTTVIAAVAAQFGFVQLENPAGSNRLLVVEYAAADSNALIYRDGNGVDSTTVQGAFSRDTRAAEAPEQRGCAIIGTGSNAAPGGGGGSVLVYHHSGNPGPGTPHIVLPPFVLSPGHNLSIWSATVNTVMRVSFGWRDRAMESTEFRR
jgi:hypothetical protein